MANKIEPQVYETTTVGYERHDLRKDRKPMYSMGGKAVTRYETVGPGPAVYTLEKNLTRVGPDLGRSYTLSPKLHYKDKIVSPGPACCTNAKILKGRTPPEFTMGKRFKIADKNEAPSPDTYTLKLDFAKRTMPSYTMGARFATQTKNKSPGPAGYSLNSNNHSPAFSISFKYPAIYDKSQRPGPNVYDLTGYQPGRGAPQFSFGMKHSPKSLPYILPCDN